MVIFDLETGGLTPEHPNIQIAALALDEKLEVVAEFERKIRFSEAKADPEALKLNHYDPAVWEAEAKDESEVCDQFSGFLKKFADIEMTSRNSGKKYSVARLGGYNAASFDGSRVKAMFERKGLFLPAHPQVLCVLQLALWKFQGKPERPKSMKLGDVCSFFEIPIESHDALGDCEATVELMKKLL